MPKWQRRAGERIFSSNKYSLLVSRRKLYILYMLDISDVRNTIMCRKSLVLDSSQNVAIAYCAQYSRINLKTRSPTDQKMVALRAARPSLTTIFRPAGSQVCFEIGSNKRDEKYNI